MKRVLLKSTVITLALLFLSYGADFLWIPADTVQHQVIENKVFDNNLILLDIRSFFDVEGGIIASENCRPYHLSYDFDDWDTRHNDLSKDVLIVIYCTAGVKAETVAQLLADEGYIVGVINGGLRSYKGALVDSTYFKPWSDLPEPSYRYSTGIVIRKRSPLAAFPSVPDVEKRLFNLKGQRVNHAISNPGAPVFILERIEGGGKKKITGLHHLIQNE